jgi:hypothetical protein
MKKEDLQGSHQGTGSAENKGEDRQQQKNRTTNLTNNDLEDTAHQAGLGRDRMADIEDLGGMSGRDDYAGGDGEGMSRENSNDRTDR